MTSKELEKIELSKRPLKSADILELGQREINGLSDKALRVLASTLVSSSNKRIRRLLNAAPKGISEAALRGGGILVKKLGEKNPDEVDVRFFSIDGKTRNQIIREVTRMTQFQQMKTSTVKGAIEVRQMNERNVFGESSEEWVSREKALERETRKIMRQMGFKKNQTPEKQAELQALLKAVREKYAPPETSGLVTKDFLKNNNLESSDVLSSVFKFYRQYEENHAVIIKDLGSDKILRLLGAYTTEKLKNIETKDALDDFLNDEMPDIIQKEWELIPDQENAQEEFFAAFERHMKTGEAVFSEKDGWR